MLSQKQIKDVCLGYDTTYKKCRYLSNDDEDYTKFYCLKKTGSAQEIDVELSEFVSGEFKKEKTPEILISQWETIARDILYSDIFCRDTIKNNLFLKSFC